MSDEDSWTIVMFGFYLNMAGIKRLTISVPPTKKKIKIFDRLTGKPAGFEERIIAGYEILPVGNKEIKLDFDINGDGDPYYIEKAFKSLTGMKVNTHIVDGQVVGIGIGFDVTDNMSEKDLIAAIRKTKSAVKMCSKLNIFKIKLKIISFHNTH